MDYINYVKEYPIQGTIGLGGGAASLLMTSGGVKAEVFRGNRGFAGMGNEGSPYAVANIRYFNLSSTGNASSFGNLTVARRNGAGVSGGGGETATRGIWGAGAGADPPGPWGIVYNILDYITIANTGNATDFGDLNWAGDNIGGAVSNGIRGVLSNGFNYHYSSAYLACGRMDYYEIATTGNATNYGNLGSPSPSYLYWGSACGSDEGRGLFGALAGSCNNCIYYINIPTTGDASNFGNLTQRHPTASCSDGSRGTWWGNGDNATIDYVTIATTSSSSDFGDMNPGVNYACGVANDTWGTVSGGNNDDGYKSDIQYVTIQTTGNAQNFGNLGVSRNYSNSFSGD
tara:strand:+ start:214 stop:1245 length:1032 start_codon:yes stop_codon:yes gene_type:complete